METAREAAPEIDRLVLSANARTGKQHNQELLDLARQRGLDSLELLSQFAEFLLADALTPGLIPLRMRYRPQDELDARLAELESGGYIQRRGEKLAAADSIRDVLEAFLSARGATAREMWEDHADQVAIVTQHGRTVSQAASPQHLVAVVHRELPQSDDPYLALHTLLTNLRYIRQHDHAEAWSSRGLSAPAMVVMTALWKGSTVDTEAEGIDQLVTAGYATRDPLTLTPEGTQLREEIEDDTNRRAQVSFDVLDEAASRELLEALRALPGSQ